MKLGLCIAFSIFLTTISVVAQVSDVDPSKYDNRMLVIPRNCPNYQLKCPPCGEDEKCIYPDSGGCPGAGIPTCKPIQACNNISCLTRRIQCPQECPFSCKYSGPSCCPFNGEPVCEPVCETFAPCQVTPCPKECPGDCFYPNADICCPQSGQPVCRNTLPTPVPISSTLAHDTKHWKGKHGGHENWDYYPDYFEGGDYYNGYYGGGDYYDGYNGGYDEGYDNEYDDHKHHYEHQDEHEHKDYHEYNRYNNIAEDEFYEGLFVGGVPKNTHCPTCTKVVTDVEISLVFATTTRDSTDVVCDKFIVPCPRECPYTCIYPMKQPCPFTEQPWCPSILDIDPIEEPECDTVFETKGYPFPYFPTADPYYTVFTSILNGSGVTSTPAFVTATPTALPNTFCPLIFKFCPVECPDSCLRPNVPCPFAAEGYCPGSAPTTTITDVDPVTPTAETVVGGDLVCPRYILACPACPESYSCTRQTTGHCANINVPYCVSTIDPPIASSDVVYQYYPEQDVEHYEDQEYDYDYSNDDFDYNDDFGYNDNFGYMENQDLHAQGLSVSKSSFKPKHKPKHRHQHKKPLLKLNVEDACTRSGLARIPSKEVFDQLQEARSDCDNCLVVKWNEDCDNTCVYRTEDDCCLKTLCLPN